MRITADSYRAAQEKARARREAIARSLPGVVDLDEWKHAVGARKALVELVGRCAWFGGAVIVHGAERGRELRVRLVYRCREAECSVPTSCNDVPVKLSGSAWQ